MTIWAFLWLFFLEAHTCCAEMGTFLQEKLPWSWKKQSRTWELGMAAVLLCGSRLGYVFVHSCKIGMLFPLEIHPKLLAEQ